MDPDDAFGAMSFLCFTEKLRTSYGNLFLETWSE